MKKPWRMLRDESGATMIEYAVVLALLSLVSLGMLSAIATRADTSLSSHQTDLNTVQTSP